MCGRRARHGCDLEKNHVTKHGLAAQPAVARRGRRSAKTDSCFMELSALPVTKFVQRAYDLRASRCHSAYPLIIRWPSRRLLRKGLPDSEYRPNSFASAIMSSVNRSSSGRPRGILRCVERCWPSVRQILRSDALRVCRT